jgi:hypothetical protein
MDAEPIYLVTDAGKPVTPFTTKDEMKAYLKRRLNTFCNLVYTFADGGGPAITTLARAMGE